MVVDDLDGVGVLVENLAPGAAVVLIAPFDVVGRHRGAVMKLDAGPQLERGALGVLGKIEAVGQMPFGRNGHRGSF